MIEAYLNAVDRSFLLIHDNGIDISAKDYRHRRLIFTLRWFTEINHSATYTCMKSLSIRYLLQPNQRFVPGKIR